MLSLSGISPVRAETENALPTTPSRHRTESVRGRVVWLGDALKRQFGISMVPEAIERSLALQTTDGHVLPLLEDLRGRSFRTDERLREKPVELLVRRYERHPLLQVIRVYEVEGDQLFEVDYWCDVCSIVMFEQGVCACCQDDNRLRRRLVEPPKREAIPAQSSPK
jgi:hypothetical protein